jgi:hypothetical protein
MDSAYIDKCQYEIREQKMFRYGIPGYTGPFRTLFLSIMGTGKAGFSLHEREFHMQSL